MADLVDASSAWEAGIYQIETVDPVVGGVPNPATGAGMSNIPHLQLARRTQFLRQQVEQLQTGGGYRSALTFSGSQVLTAADMGRCYIYGETTAVSMTLPLVADVPVGSVVEFVNTGTANMTVQRSGADQIDTGPTSVTSVVVPPNMSLRLIRATGSSLWHAIGLTAQALSSTLGSLIAGNGWQRLPSGLLIQWGGAVNNATPGVQTAVVFPLAFPTACHVALVNPVTTNSGVQVAYVEDRNTSFFRMKANVASLGVFWIAIGN